MQISLELAYPLLALATHYIKFSECFLLLHLVIQAPKCVVGSYA